MRILYVSEDYTTHDRRFLKAIVDGGHEAFFFRLKQNRFIKEQRSLPPNVQVVGWAISSHPVIGLRRTAKSVRPDLVHAGPLFNATFYAALSGCRPLVGMSWGYDILLEAERSIFKRLKTRYALTRCTSVIADSQVIKNKVISYGVEPSQVEVFPWGVDLSHYKPCAQSDLRRSLGWDDRIIVMCNRNWEPMYGVDLVVRAFITVAKIRRDLALILLGSGSQAQYIQQLVNRSSVKEQIRLVGYVDYDSMPEYYRAADLYISASRTDGSSISLLEAMACGRPVLVSDIPGNQGWVEVGRDGWWFKDGDVENLAVRLDYAIANKEKLTTMGQSARKKVETRADWSKGEQKLMIAYEKCVR